VRRALKNLDITLDLAVIPVQLFMATSSQGVAFHLLHATARQMRQPDSDASRMPHPQHRAPRRDGEGSGIVINPAGLTFRSIPILDALKMFPGPIIALHISNVHRREEIYHRSLMSRVATAVIMGFGPDGYPTAVGAMVRVLGAGS
jgi:3-dehydroquinate dehydratase